MFNECGLKNFYVMAIIQNTKGVIKKNGTRIR